MKKLFILCLLLGAAWFWWRGPNSAASAVFGVYDPRLLAEPAQNMIAVPRDIPLKEGYSATTLASFVLQGRVLSKSHYRLDREARLAPYDIAFGWGPMASPDILSRISITQGGRFYHYRYSFDNPPGISQSAIASNSANMHLIPANDEVKARIAGLKRGDPVRLEGYLVAVRGPGGYGWTSSLTRHDTGNGACEVIYVTGIGRLSP